MSKAKSRNKKISTNDDYITNVPHKRITFFSMISDPVRHNILNNLLEQKECSVSQLIETLSKPQTLVSYHLRVLKESGIVNSQKSKQDGRQTLYSLHDPRAIKDMFDSADKFIEIHEDCGNRACKKIK